MLEFGILVLCITFVVMHGERNLCVLLLSVLILGERFTPGIGHVDTCDELKREIIHQLCIRPMAHSELVKALPENVSKHTHLCATLHLYFSASLCMCCKDFKILHFPLGE